MYFYRTLISVSVLINATARARQCGRMQRASTVGKMDGRSLLESFRSVIPPETFSSYKGQSGRIAVVGGSTEWVCEQPCYIIRATAQHSYTRGTVPTAGLKGRLQLGPLINVYTKASQLQLHSHVSIVLLLCLFLAQVYGSTLFRRNVGNASGEFAVQTSAVIIQGCVYTYSVPQFRF